MAIDSARPSTRLDSIDVLRGAIMIIMALDHVRDFIHAGAQQYSPIDLTRTYPFLFFTRWITHFCAPVFSFTAGLGAFLWYRRGRTRPQLSQFLVTRGLWLIFLELTWMRFAYTFDYSVRSSVLLVVLWQLGASMIVLAGLIYLPLRVLAVVSVATIALHNLLDPLRATQFGAFGPVWKLLHGGGAFPLFGLTIRAGYPLLPWIALMAAGFCFGEVFTLPPARRQRIIFATGAGLTLAFVVLRAINRYGDPSRWTTQPTPVYTLLSFLNCTKYPPSLLYVLMTLGPALIFLAWLDGRSFSPNNPLVVFGRVPLFYYLTHFMLAHIIASVLILIRYGWNAYPLIFMAYPSLGGNRAKFPTGFGYPLWVVYLIWFSLVVFIYFPCRWFARLKAERRTWWLSYL